MGSPPHPLPQALLLHRQHLTGCSRGSASGMGHMELAALPPSFNFAHDCWWWKWLTWVDRQGSKLGQAGGNLQVRVDRPQPGSQPIRAMAWWLETSVLAYGASWCELVIQWTCKLTSEDLYQVQSASRICL